MSRSVASIVPVEPGHIEHVAANIREADAVEVYEAARRDVLYMMQRSYKRSDRNATLMVRQEPVAVIGVGRLSTLSSVGVPWMLGTDGVTKHARHLLPYGSEVVRKMMQGHTVLRNMVHVDNKASIRWLKSLGFTLHDAEPLGWRGAMFHTFEKKEDTDV